VFASRKRVEKELKEFFEDEDAFVRELAAAFPQTKTALIDERNAYMARGIEAVSALGPVVVAVVGAGHVSGIRDELVRSGKDPASIRIVNLKSLQGPAEAPGAPPPPGALPPSNAEFSVTFDRSGRGGVP
jgi:pheromone shutdown protein TraB